MTQSFAELKEQFNKTAAKSIRDVDFCFEVLIKHRLTIQAEREEMTALYISTKINTLSTGNSTNTYILGTLYNDLHKGFAASCLPENCDAVFKTAFRKSMEDFFSSALEFNRKTARIEEHLDSFLNTMTAPIPGTEHLLPPDIKAMLAEFSLAFIEKIATNQYEDYHAAEAFRMAARKIAVAADKVKPPAQTISITAGTDMTRPDVTINPKKAIHLKIVTDSTGG
jgi:hypothetical protein